MITDDMVIHTHDGHPMPKDGTARVRPLAIAALEAIRMAMRAKDVIAAPAREQKNAKAVAAEAEADRRAEEALGKLPR